MQCTIFGKRRTLTNNRKVIYSKYKKIERKIDVWTNTNCTGNYRKIAHENLVVEQENIIRTYEEREGCAEDERCR